MYLILLKLTGKPLYTAAQQYCTVAYIITTYILFVSKTKKMSRGMNITKEKQSIIQI